MAHSMLPIRIQSTHSLLIGCMLLLPTLTTAYEGESAPSGWKSIQPIRTSVKVGSPDLVSLELESIIPSTWDLLGLRLSVAYLSIGNGETVENGQVVEKSKGGLTHFGIGANIYPFGEGRGLFASTGYDRVSAFNNVIKTQTDEEDMVNPTQMLSMQLGYRYVGRRFTYTFFGGYGLNFGYKTPTKGVDEPDDILFKPGDWIQAGFSWGIAFPWVN